MDLLDGVEALHRNSLLRLEETAHDEPRFRMLETIHDYGLERLAASGMEEELRRRHADYFLRSPRRPPAASTAPPTALWLDRLEADHDNLRAALAWCMQHDTPSGSAAGEPRSGRSGMSAGMSPRAGRCWRLSLNRPAGRGVTAPRRSLAGRRSAGIDPGDHTAAWTSWTTASRMYPRAGDERGTAAALLSAGLRVRLQEEYLTATTLLEEGLTLARATGHISLSRPRCTTSG